MKFFLALSFVALLLAGVCLHLGWYVVPGPWNPFAPLHIDDEPNVLTRYKLARIRSDASMCMAALESSNVIYTPIADRSTGPGCGFTNAVTVSRTEIALGSSAPMSCRNAVSLALWERHVVLPAARTYIGQPLTKIEHLGSYSCRNVYGEADRPRSLHATADALDVSAFVFRDGTRISVLSDWKRSGAAAQFLHAVHDGACNWFDGVLGPNYNAAHANHFHLDSGPYAVCR